MRILVPIIVIVLVSLGYFFLLHSSQRYAPPPPFPLEPTPTPSSLAPSPNSTSLPESGTPEPISEAPPSPPSTAVPNPVVIPSPQPAPPPPPPPASSSVREFRITAKKWSFTPSSITVNFGDHVRLLVTSIDVDHGLAIAELGVNSHLYPNSTQIIEFTASKRGTFSMFCSVLCGAGHANMKGSFIVQ